MIPRVVIVPVIYTLQCNPLPTPFDRSFLWIVLPAVILHGIYGQGRNLCRAFEGWDFQVGKSRKTETRTRGVGVILCVRVELNMFNVGAPVDGPISSALFCVYEFYRSECTCAGASGVEDGPRENRPEASKGNLRVVNKSTKRLERFYVFGGGLEEVCEMGKMRELKLLVIRRTWE